MSERNGDHRLPTAREETMEFIGKLQSRDPQAVGLLVESTFRIAGRMSSSLGLFGPDGEDVKQETFLNAWRKLETYDSERGSLSTWLIRIAHNKAVDGLRRKGRDLKRCSPIDPQADFEDTEGSFEDSSIDQISHEPLREAFKTLPLEQQDALHYRYVMGLTHQEISNLTGAPLGTIKTRTRLGLEKLRKSVPNPNIQ